MSQNDWSDGYTSDYLRNLNAYGPASANVPRSSVVSHQVRYRTPDTSDIPLAPGQNPEDSVYSNAPGARMGQLKPRSGYNPPAGGGYTAETFPSSGAGDKRYARPKGTQSRSRGSAPANGVKTRSAPLSGSDVTAAVMKAVKADGNTSFADWRSSLQRQGWDGDPSRIKYDPSTGKFVDTGVKAAGAKAASGTASGGDVTPEQTEAQVSHRAESYPAEVQPGENLGDLDGQLTAEIEKRRNMPGGQEFLNKFVVKAKEYFNQPEYKALSDVDKIEMMLGWLRDMNNNPDKYKSEGSTSAPKSEPPAQAPSKSEPPAQPSAPKNTEPTADSSLYMLKPGYSDRAPQPVPPRMSVVGAANAVTAPPVGGPEPAQGLRAEAARVLLARLIGDISDREQLYGNSGSGAVYPQAVDAYYNRGRRE